MQPPGKIKSREMRGGKLVLVTYTEDAVEEIEKETLAAEVILNTLHGFKLEIFAPGKNTEDVDQKFAMAAVGALKAAGVI